MLQEGFEQEQAEREKEEAMDVEQEIQEAIEDDKQIKDAVEDDSKMQEVLDEIEDKDVAEIEELDNNLKKMIWINGTTGLKKQMKKQKRILKKIKIKGCPKTKNMILAIRRSNKTQKKKGRTKPVT